jgi:hypothetical protein
MGEAYSNALSVLQFRHCVLFGKASSSKRPVIVELRQRDFYHLTTTTSKENPPTSQTSKGK